MSNDPFLLNDLNQLALYGISVVWTPKTTPGTPQTITGILTRPPIEEDAIPGSEEGTTSIYLWVRADQLTPQPGKGDTITINNVVYACGKAFTDLIGGSTLRLRRKSS